MSIALNRRLKDVEIALDKAISRIAELEAKTDDQAPKPKRGRPFKQPNDDVGLKKNANG